jgi:hypothetical protein
MPVDSCKIGFAGLVACARAPAVPLRKFAVEVSAPAAVSRFPPAPCRRMRVLKKLP